MPFNMGPMEMLIVGVIAVLLFGNRLPSVMRSLGKSVMEFKKGLADIQNDVDTAASGRSVSYHRDPEDYEEPTAPKFEPPAAQPPAPATEVHPHSADV